MRKSASGIDSSAAIAFDAEWYRQTLIRTVDLWNGGHDDKTGMGAYTPDFTGFFNVGINRWFAPSRIAATTSVAQSRAIYINVEAYRAAGPEGGTRFLDAAIKDADYMLRYFRDASTAASFGK
jgi:hypothetical protein